MSSLGSGKTLANARGSKCALLSRDREGAVMLTLSLRQANRWRRRSTLILDVLGDDVERHAFIDVRGKVHHQ